MARRSALGPRFVAASGSLPIRLRQTNLNHLCAHRPSSPGRAARWIGSVPGTPNMVNCTACHGERGVSTSDLVPTLAGMDAAVIYKELADYRSGKRSWGVMDGVAEALSVQDSADVGVYFAEQPGGLPVLTGVRVPNSGRTLRESDPATRLVFAGDPA